MPDLCSTSTCLVLTMQRNVLHVALCNVDKYRLDFPFSSSEHGIPKENHHANNFASSRLSKESFSLLPRRQALFANTTQTKPSHQLHYFIEPISPPTHNTHHDYSKEEDESYQRDAKGTVADCTTRGKEAASIARSSFGRTQSAR